MTGATLRRWTGTEFKPQPQDVIAFGGETYDIPGYRLHVFDASSEFIVTKEGYGDVLFVAGGGAGSSGTAGGGAGGEVFDNDAMPFFLPIGVHELIIGPGGVAPPGVTSAGQNGGDTSGLGITVKGGGRGGHTGGSTADATDGGNGGGGANYQGLIKLNGQPLDPAKGYAGAVAPSDGGGGGGGAGGPGDDRQGGPGKLSLIMGSPVRFGGGGGGSDGSGGVSGLGGDGGGGDGNSASASPGVNGRGGGGGGGWYYANGLGARGGSGLIIIRYAI